jgi:polyhydroxybutyrate depolymerase
MKATLSNSDRAIMPSAATQIFGILLYFFACIFAARASPANEIKTRALDVGGTERHYILSAPPSGGPRPAIFVLHGGGMSANSGLHTTGMEPLVARENLVAVYPNAFFREWNDGRKGRERNRGNADDVAFIRALIAALVAEGIVDPKRVYVTGPSNGGMMTLRLLCEAPERFAAAAPIIASLPVDIANKCNPTRPLPVLVINGTSDPLVPYTGGGVGFAGRRGNVISTDETMASLRRFNGCTDANKSEQLPDLDPDDGSTVTITSWTNCSSGAPVVLYRIDGGGHRIPHRNGARMQMMDRLLGAENHDFDAPEAIWAFFRDKKL